MATFSTNQVRQLYVATSQGAVTSEGGIIVTGDNGSGTLASKLFWLKHYGKGGVVKSDNILKGKVKSIKQTSASKMAKALNRVMVSLDPNVNSGAPIAGQDYILRLAFRQFVGLSDEDQYFKYGEVKATTGMTASQFYAAMKSSIDKNFSNENKVCPLISTGSYSSIKGSTNTGLTVNFVSPDAVSFAIASVSASAASVSVSSGAVSVSLTAANKSIADIKKLVSQDAAASALVVIEGNDTVDMTNTESLAASGATEAGILITAVPQPWIIGRFAQTEVQYTVQDVDIIASGIASKWASIKVAPIAGAIGNGKAIADLEYFCMGERGDIYRNVGYPHSLVTNYMVDPSHTYDTIDITYYSEGEAEDVQKSPKVITIACDTTANITSTIANTLNTISGVVVETN